MRIEYAGRIGAAQPDSGLRIQDDAYTKSLQRQIADAQKRLQDVSADQDLSLEEKMKKCQEIQQEITNLNQQLRQHQIEQRREQQSEKTSQTNDSTASDRTSEKVHTGLSKAHMQAMISADVSIRQADVQGSVAGRMNGRAGVLESEIRQDAGRGDTKRKEKELSELQGKAQSATNAQMSALFDADRAMKKAQKADDIGDDDDKDEEEKKDQPDADRKEEERISYTPIDVRL